MKHVFEKINSSGFIEFIFISFEIFFQKVSSRVNIFFYKIRGYALDYSVILGKNIVIFQSTRHSVRISRNVFIGDGVRMKAGFSGKIIIGENSYVHDYSFIFAHKSLSIGKNTLISPNVFITDFDHKLPHERYKHLLGSEKGYESKQVSIGDNVWIGANSVILPGVTIGNNTVIGAGSVVTKSISPSVIAVGNPARIIRKIK
jgi:acetyltransferase-like isoleucine patch superfamily enzyme